MFVPKSVIVGVVSFVSVVWAAVDPADTIVFGQTFLAGSQDPTSGSTPWSLVSHGIAEKLFTVNQKDEIVGQLAESVKKISENEWEVTLKTGHKFSDGTEVDAQHVAECLTELNEKNDAAKSSLGKMTVTVPEGEKTKVTIKSERVTHVMDAVLAQWVFVVYHKNEKGEFLYTGPYKVDHFAADHIDLKPNEFYAQASERPSIEIIKYSDGDALAKGVKEGKVDVGFHLPIHTLPDLKATTGISIESFEVGYHYMAFHNLDSLPDVNVRKAIDLAIDRTALSDALSGGKGTRSLFPDYSPYYKDDSDPDGDAEAAEKLLDQAGWTLNADGKRTKDGEILTVHLVAYPHRPGLGIMQPVIAKSLEDVGVTVNTTMTGMDWDETSKIMSDRSFDLLLWAQHTLPAGDPHWFLHNFFHSESADNHANLRSTAVDGYLDALSAAEQHSDRVAKAAVAHKAILDEVPVSNLVTPYWHVGLSQKMSDYEPWGSDYYVIRAGLFVSESDSSGTVRHFDSALGQSVLLFSSIVSFVFAVASL